MYKTFDGVTEAVLGALYAVPTVLPATVTHTLTILPGEPEISVELVKIDEVILPPR